MKMNWWLVFSLLTVSCWGLYGIALHGGALGMKDPADGRYKAFLLVGLMYFVFAVVAPLLLLIARGGNINILSYPRDGVMWSCLAGILGAAGAFGVLLAFGAKGHPAVVMSIVFGGAPVLNALVSLLKEPPKGGFGTVSPMFFAGILLAALGGCLVTLYKPAGGPTKHAQAAVQMTHSADRP